MRRPAGVVPVVCALVLGGACGEVRLVDPKVTGVPVAGAYVEVGVQARGDDSRLVFQGHVFGYEARGASRLVRYLDAGRIVVGGRVAERRFVRLGEPVYRLDAVVDGELPATAVRIGGSEVVPACALDVPVPAAGSPADGDVVPRGEDLAVPVAALPDTLGPADRVLASVEAVDAAGRWYRTDISPGRAVGGALVVPESFLHRLPPGTAELTLRIVWERSTPAGVGGPPCAPALFARAWYEHRVVVRVE
ncbi:MAG TPA: hypothetical protein VF212_00875 [Longimicrobiales bacterium]